MCQNGNNNREDKDMGVTGIKDKSTAKKHTKKIPHLKTVNGKVIIDGKDPRHVKWFKEFKK